MVWDNIAKQVSLIELTVCFETNFEAVRERKVSRYMDLVEDVEQSSYGCDLLTVEVGSRGVVEVERLGRLRRLLDVGREWSTDVPNETCRDSHARITQDLEPEELEVRGLVLGFIH